MSRATSAACRVCGGDSALTALVASGVQAAVGAVFPVEARRGEARHFSVSHRAGCPSLPLAQVEKAAQAALSALGTSEVIDKASEVIDKASEVIDKAEVIDKESEVIDKAQAVCHCRC